MLLSSEKIVVITGASSGIGAELARLCAKKGAKTVICARRTERLETLAEEVRASGGVILPITADVSRQDDAQKVIRQAVEEFGTVDVLINNAGRGNLASVEDTTPEQLESIFGVNVFALWYTAAAALPVMKSHNSGHIVTVSSVAGTMGFPFDSAYVAAKHAAVGFHASLRAELLETNILSTLICPDGVSTEWGGVTEGGSIGELFAAGIKRSRTIARERGIGFAPLSRMISAEVAAQIIIDAIENPDSPADVYTHPGTHDRAIATTRSREEVEQLMLPLYLGMRQEYDLMYRKNHA